MSKIASRVRGHRFHRASACLLVVLSGACGSPDEGAIDVAAAERGADLIDDCRACHALNSEVSQVGPHLVRIVGRDIASLRNFKYSDALLILDGKWTPERLASFIIDPTSVAPGTMMAYGGISKDEARDVVEHLRSLAR